MSKARTALIADDHSLYRCGLSLWLKDEFGYGEIAEASSFEEACGLMGERAGFELALFDLSMPGMQGPESLTPLRVRHPDTRIAIVAASEAKTDVLQAIASRLSGFIPKSLPSSELRLAIKTVLEGRVYVPSLTMYVANATSGISADRVAMPAISADALRQAATQLTHRQRDVLECVRVGMTNREIAEQLGISVGTVKIHVAALLAALNVHSRVLLTTANAAAGPKRTG